MFSYQNQQFVITKFAILVILASCVLSLVLSIQIFNNWQGAKFDGTYTNELIKTL